MVGLPGGIQSPLFKVFQVRGEACYDISTFNWLQSLPSCRRFQRVCSINERKPKERGSVSCVEQS